MALTFAVVLAAGLFGTPSAQTQAFQVIHTFGGGTDGSNPYAGLLRDAKGNLYGATNSGGKNGLGTIFKVSNTGKETVLYAFAGGNDGRNPDGGLVLDSEGSLYGTTHYGGITTCADGSSCGTVFKLDKTGKETVLYTFTGGADGGLPYAGLIRDTAGNLYGTTSSGGNLNCFGLGCGTVFMLDTSGKETVLYAFTGNGDDGRWPYSSVIRDSNGNLYGTTAKGGISCGFLRSCGTVFKLDSTGKETMLYVFTGKGDGMGPNNVIRDANGNLYGTTSGGGSGSYPCCGVVFKLDVSGNETVLYTFTGGRYGGSPVAGVIRDAAGNLYGTTYYGGRGNCNDGNGVGCGVVFKLDTTGKETVLHSFTGGADGAYPQGDLIFDNKGNLYGTAMGGGASGYGVVFKLTPQ